MFLEMNESSELWIELEEISGNRARTDDTRIMIPLLYQLSYAAS